MNKYIVLSIFLLVVLSQLIINGCNTKTDNNVEVLIKQYYNVQVDSTIANLDVLIESAAKKTIAGDLQKDFLNSRLSYKKIEAITEYYFQGLTRRINGPAYLM